MNKEEIEKAKIGLWNIRADCLKIIQCGLSDKQDREGYLKEIDVVDDIFKYIKELEQKSEKLDKVTDKLNKNQASDYQVLTKTEYRLRKMNRKEYDTNGNGRYLSDLRDTLLNRIEYQQEILNIIEGEKK